MKKEYIIGGLAIVGGLSLLAYFTSKPRRNSEGFFNARGQGLGNTDGLPSRFTRQPQGSTIQSLRCHIYMRQIDSSGNVIYTKQQMGGNLTEGISYRDFKNAYYNLPKCNVPYSFTRQDEFYNLCVQYRKFVNSEGFLVYSKGIITTHEVFSITKAEFENAYFTKVMCA